MAKKTYFDDIEVGSVNCFGEYKVTKEEIISFAEKWDPMPFHTDEEAAKTSVFGGLVACSAHTFAMQSGVANQNPKPLALMAGLGLEELRLPNPVRPDDILSIESTVLDKRPSKSHDDRGIVTTEIRLVNQNKETVMQQRGSVLVHRK